MAEIKRKLKPFTVPNFVIEDVGVRPRQEGFKEASSHPLSDVDADVLSEMCDEWRSEVFRKAGKPDPRELNWQTEPNQ